MSPWALILGDLALAAGFTARLTRLIVTDDLGTWWVRLPAMHWARRHDDALPPIGEWEDVAVTAAGIEASGTLYPVEQTWIPGWRSKLTSGLSCPWCIGHWFAGAVLLSLWLVGGPGHAAEWWRYVAGWFTMNWIVAHVGVRLGDAGYSDD